MCTERPQVSLQPAGVRVPSALAATGWGLLACCLWCTSIAVTRRVTEDVGVLRGGMLVLGLAGLLGVLRACLQGRLRQALSGLSRAYLLGCGACFVAYQFCLLLAIGLAVDGLQVVVVGVINYLWPALTLAVSVPLLQRRWSGWLVLGLLLTVAGEVLVVGSRLFGGTKAASALDLHSLLCFGLAAVAAICWALYSNLARRLAGVATGDAVPLFLSVTSLSLLPLVLLFPEPVHWTAQTPWAVAFMAVCPGLLAYTWWDRGMRFGHAKLLTVISYLIPLGSTAATSLVLRVWPEWSIWIGAGMVLGGAFVCHYSVSDEASVELQ
ncbi:MAG: EamA family transporter [Planctomycetota bacterium]|nr:EamA family transporter [Planctomycetota bacterium]